jgi:hypothetical protein
VTEAGEGSAAPVAAKKEPAVKPPRKSVPAPASPTKPARAAVVASVAQSKPEKEEEKKIAKLDEATVEELVSFKNCSENKNPRRGSYFKF